MHRKLLCLLALFVLALPLLSFPVTAQDTEPVVITMWHGGGEGYNDDLRESIGDFLTENPNIDFVAQPVDWSVYEQRVLAAAAGSDLPDMIEVNPQFGASIIERGLMVPITEYFQDDLDQYPQGLLDTYYDSNGELVCLPNLGGADMLYYRTDFAAEAGLTDFPTTWEGLVEWGKALVQYDENGNITREGLSWRLGGPGAHWPGMQFQLLLLGQGVNLLNDEGTEATFGGPEGVRALQFMHDTIWVDKISLPLSKQISPPEGIMPLLAGVTAIDFIGPWAPSAFVGARQDNPDLANVWDAAYLYPAPDENGQRVSLVGAGGWCIFSGTEHFDESLQVLRALSREQTHETLYIKYGHPVSRTDATMSDGVTAYLQEMWPGAAHLRDLWADPDVAAASVSELHHPQNARIYQALADGIINIMEDPDADIEGELAYMVDEVNSIVGS